jgi:hypothetical protein
MLLRASWTNSKLSSGSGARSSKVSEFAFPLLGTAIIVALILPACALLAKLALLALERNEAGGPLHGLTVRFLVLTGSSVLPLAWFFSAGLHQAETGQSVLVCLFVHGAATLCLESGLFALALGTVVVTGSIRVVPNVSKARARQDGSHALLERLERIVETYPMLWLLRGRLEITDAADFSVGTHRCLRPRVLVGSAFAARLTDEVLASALAHESVHLRSWDPLRYLLVELSLVLNPLGRFLLESHARTWFAAREAHCDREAVLQGCSPLSLADAIVRAARPTAVGVAPLGASDMGELRLRVGMLMAFAECRPTRSCERGIAALPVALGLLLLTLLAPHQSSTAVLDALHRGSEHALTYFL